MSEILDKLESVRNVKQHLLIGITAAAAEDNLGMGWASYEKSVKEAYKEYSDASKAYTARLNLECSWLTEQLTPGNEE